MPDTLKLEYYSDILCVWAWIAQTRLDELQNNFADQITVKSHFINVFGDAPGKFATQWKDKGELSGYRAHLEEVIEPFGLKIHKDTWRDTVPLSSLNAHLVAKAVENTTNEETLAQALRRIRQAFFEEAKDVSDFDSLIEIVSSLPLDSQELREEIATGRAASALMNDYKQAENLKLRGSPSFVLDGGRQILFGNVGYRVLHANVEELLASEENATWC